MWSQLRQYKRSRTDLTHHSMVYKATKKGGAQWAITGPHDLHQGRWSLLPVSKPNITSLFSKPNHMILGPKCKQRDRDFVHQGKMPRGQVFMRYLRTRVGSQVRTTSIDHRCQSVSVSVEKGHMTKCWDVTADLKLVRVQREQGKVERELLADLYSYMDTHTVDTAG